MLSKFFSSRLSMPNGILGINERNCSLIYELNNRKDYKFADDKLLTKQVLEGNGLACPKTFAVIHHIGNIERTWESLQANDSIVIKPAMGSGGNGIKILRRKNNQWFQGKNPVSEDQIFSHIANILFGIYSFGDTDKAIIEELILPHATLTNIYEHGVADIRVILCNQKPLMAMLRLPTSESDGKANLHQGGLGVGIDLQTGKLTHTYDGKSYIEHHPDSGAKIRDIQIPDWQDLMELSVKVARSFPLNYLGIDIVIDKNKGPLVLEVNVRPGLGIQMANKKGLKATLTEFAAC